MASPKNRPSGKHSSNYYKEKLMKDLDLGKIGKNRTVPNLKGIKNIISPKSIPRRPQPINDEETPPADTEERLTNRVNRINSFSPVFAATTGNFRSVKNRDKK